MKEYGEKCIIAVGSMTVLDCRYTKDAVALLSGNGIRYSEVIKTGGEKY